MLFTNNKTLSGPRRPGEIIKIMDLEKIKHEMKKYRDLYGGRLLDFSLIDDCKTISDCENIIELHRQHLEGMLSDADRNLDNFKKRIGIF